MSVANLARKRSLRVSASSFNMPAAKLARNSSLRVSPQQAPTCQLLILLGIPSVMAIRPNEYYQDKVREAEEMTRDAEKSAGGCGR